MVKKAFLYTALRNAHLRNDPKTGQNGALEPVCLVGRIEPRDHTDTSAFTSRETCPGKSNTLKADHAANKPEEKSKVTKSKSSGDGPITIKKYANRRLYNTATSSYVTLENLADMVKQGDDFKVYDAKSGDDITKSVLTQIIFEEEAKGQNLLPIQFLRQLIGFYDDNMKVFVPSFLEMSMESFTKSQDEIKSRLNTAFDPDTTFKNFEDQIRQNMAMFQSTMQSFSPFGAGLGEQSASTEAEPEEQAPSNDTSKDDSPASDMDDLKSQLAAMQAQLDKLAKE